MDFERIAELEQQVAMLTNQLAEEGRQLSDAHDLEIQLRERIATLVEALEQAASKFKAYDWELCDCRPHDEALAIIKAALASVRGEQT